MEFEWLELNKVGWLGPYIWGLGSGYPFHFLILIHWLFHVASLSFLIDCDLWDATATIPRGQTACVSTYQASACLTPTNVPLVCKLHGQRVGSEEEHRSVNNTKCSLLEKHQCNSWLHLPGKPLKTSLNYFVDKAHALNLLCVPKV